MDENFTVGPDLVTDINNNASAGETDVRILAMSYMMYKIGTSNNLIFPKLSCQIV